MDRACQSSRKRSSSCESEPRNALGPSSIAVPSLMAILSADSRCASGTLYTCWQSSSKTNSNAEERAKYYANLHKGVLPEYLNRQPKGKRATSLLELMTIRAFHSKTLRSVNLGTAVGFRIRMGELTDIPAVLVFVSKKLHKRWLSQCQCLPSALEGPGGIWCDVDVVEISNAGPPGTSLTEQFYSEIAEDLRGRDGFIGPGSQIATQDNFGTLGAIVKSQTGCRQVGFLTNRHVAVDLECPNQKLYHPSPPSLGPSVYLGAVERATSFTSDDFWYGVFATIHPETFVRVDGAFVTFSEDFEMSAVSTSVKGVGEMGEVKLIDLQAPISTVIGRKVMKTGSCSGLTKGTVLAYSLEYNDDKGVSFFNDLLVVGENKKPFDFEGDSGSLILMEGEDGKKPRPIGIIWGGTASRSRIKMRIGGYPTSWTSAVDLGRLLNLLELSLITTQEDLKAAMDDQMIVYGSKIDCLTSDCQPQSKTPPEKGRLDINAPPNNSEHQDEEKSVVEELQLIASVSDVRQTSRSPDTPESLASLRSNDDADTCAFLHLGAKRKLPEDLSSAE